MAVKESIRPGGRSARIQASVHEAVHSLLAEGGREALTMPLIAARAGVTPSTLYRRWGELSDLLADVALERWRPDGTPADTGSLRSDLRVWFEQYAEEMSSGLGRLMLRDVLASTPETGRAAQCCLTTMEQLTIMVNRTAARQDPVPLVSGLLDHVVAPILYRILFRDQVVGAIDCQTLIDHALHGVEQGRGGEPDNSPKS